MLMKGQGGGHTPHHRGPPAVELLRQGRKERGNSNPGGKVFKGEK
jgi:hypothetical protein